MAHDSAVIQMTAFFTLFSVQLHGQGQFVFSWPKHVANFVKMTDDLHPLLTQPTNKIHWYPGVLNYEDRLKESAAPSWHHSKPGRIMHNMLFLLPWWPPRF